MNKAEFARIIREHLRVVEQHKFFRTSRKKPSSSEPWHLTNRLIDRVRIQFLYCRTLIEWEVIFDSHEPNNIPDVILQESLEDFVHDITSIHAFKNWEFQNTKGLLNILLELVQLYSNYQASLIQDVAHPQVKFEYDTSQEYQGVQFFVVDPSLMERSEIRCVVPLYFESQESPVSLHVQWSPKDTYPVTMKTDLDLDYISDNWKNILHKFKLPSWTADSCLVTYIPLVRETLSECQNLYFKRRDILTILRAELGNPAEYDSNTFKKISFIFHETGQCPYVAVFKFNKNFPATKPSFFLISIFNTVKGKPLSGSINFAYQPEWSPEKLCRAIIDALPEALNEFHIACTTRAQL